MAQLRRSFPQAFALTMAVLALLGLACAGGGGEGRVAPAPQQPAAAAPPAPAAPAPEPQAARPPAGQAAQAPAAAPRPAAPAVKEPKYGGVALFSHRGDPPVAWDPMRTDTLFLHAVSASLYGSGNLVKPCRGNVYEVCPALAESWGTNSDFTQWTFKIRDNARWHDGKPFTAEDAKYWVELAFRGAEGGGKSRAPAIFKADFGDLQKVEVLEGNRLRIALDSPAPQYPGVIAMPRYSVAHPRHLMQPRIEKGEVSVAPQEVGWVATGPFKMLKFEKGSLIQVRRFDQYWEKDEKGRQLPFLDGIDFPFIPDPGAMDAAFRVGRLDAGAKAVPYYLTRERQAAYVRDLGDKVWFAETGGARSALGFNVLKTGPFQDVRVRKAVSLWIDRQEYIDSIQGGAGYLAPLLHPNNPFSSPDFPTWPGWNRATREADRAEAKRLLAQAGYASRFQAELPCRRVLVGQCEFVHAQLGGLGVDVKIQLLDDTAFIGYARLSLDFPLLQGGLAAYHTVPEGTAADLAPYSVTKYAVGKHEDPKIPEFFRRLNAATSLDQRVKIWRELERYYLLEQVYAVPSGGILALVPYRSYVKGVVAPVENTYSDLDFATVWLDR